MIPFRTSQKIQAIRPQNPYVSNLACGVCLQNTSDYSPFGVSLDGRTMEGDFYRYGYNTQDRTDEISGKGNHFTAQFWEYSPRLAKRWNIDPINYPWQSSYSVNNNNPVVFTDPLGLFGSRKEAKIYKRENDIHGRISKDKKGIYYLDDKKNKTSYYRDPNSNFQNLYGEQEDGVMKTVIVPLKKTIFPSLGDYMSSIEKFGEKSGGIKVSTEPLKSSQKLKYYDNAWSGNQYTKTKNVISPILSESFAKFGKRVGYVLTAKEIIDGFQSDGNTIGVNTAIQVSGALGSYGGSYGGAIIGATIGSAIFPGVGTLLGGTIGAFLGSWGGEVVSESVTKGILKK
jgi:hypothetical protein